MNLERQMEFLAIGLSEMDSPTRRRSLKEFKSNNSDQIDIIQGMHSF